MSRSKPTSDLGRAIQIFLSFEGKQAASESHRDRKRLSMRDGFLIQIKQKFSRSNFQQFE